MPLFFRHRLLFIHIPKCGGDTVNYGLRAAGDKPFLFVANGSVMVNGHTPQHMVWRELKKAGWSGKTGFRVAALVRHPVDRVLSEFRYIHVKRPDLVPFATDPSRFLDAFLSSDRETSVRFDNHNLGLLDFLRDRDGEIDPTIHIRPVQEMDRWLAELGLPRISAADRQNVTREVTHLPAFRATDIDRILEHYSQDVLWFEQRFPAYRRAPR